MTACAFWPFKVIYVIDFRTSRIPAYDFLLVINCDLGLILHRFRYIAPHSSLSLNRGHPLEFRCQIYHAESWDILILFCGNRAIVAALQSFCHNTLASQTTDDTSMINDQSRTLQYNGNIRLKFVWYVPLYDVFYTAIIPTRDTLCKVELLHKLCFVLPRFSQFDCFV